MATAWETFDNSAQRDRARTLNGAYACSEDVVKDDKTKRFDKLAAGIAALGGKMVGSRSRLF